jgi:hypothetical protein
MEDEIDENEIEVENKSNVVERKERWGVFFSVVI